jgi:hypothetical protein
MSILSKIMYTYINYAPRYHIPKSRDPRRSFFGTQPGCSLNHRRAQSQVQKRKDLPNGHYVPRSRVLPCLQSRREGDGSRVDQDRLDRDNGALFGVEPRSLVDYSPGSGGLLRSGQTSFPAALTHSIVFAVVFALLRRQFPQFY